MTTGSGPLFMAPEPARPKPNVPKPTVAESETAGKLGPCRYIVDDDSGRECANPGKHKVRVDTREVPANIILCNEHRWEMNHAYAARRQRHKNAS